MQITKLKSINSLGENTRGCKKAPDEILKFLREISFNEKGKEVVFEKINLSEIYLDSDNYLEIKHLIFESAKETFERNFKTFFLGGDHSITYPIGLALQKTQINPLILVFDSHLDCLDGSAGIHRSWIRKLTQEGFDSSKIVIIGARNISLEESKFVFNEGITYIKMDLIRENIEEICDLVMERARASSGFYISLDLSFVDPAFAPGVTNSEVGGVSSRDLIYFIKRLSILGNFIGGDIVEINPDFDFGNITSKLGAKIISEMI